jgi:uncharacterized damage-inducible protein DinB
MSLAYPVPVGPGGDSRGLRIGSEYRHGRGAGPVTTENRVGPPSFGSERDMLRAFLDYHRSTLAMKCEGLTDEELRQQSMPPSTLSLLGLVRHMAEVERAWFRRVFEDNDAPMVWSDKVDFQAAYDASASTRDEAFAAWEAEVENSRRIEREAESLDLAGYQPRWGEAVSLRMVMVHVLLEYGRHNGHADFLREGVDGTVGA